MNTAPPPRTNNQRIAAHHEATAALHRSYAATVGLESIEAAHCAAAEDLVELAANFRRR